MLFTPTTPTESSGLSPHEASPVEASGADLSELWLNRCRQARNLHSQSARAPPVRMQRYLCSICGGTFSPSLSSVEDGHRYPSEVKRLGRVVNAFTDASLEALQDICTVHFGLRPSDQQLSNWTTEDMREIVENDLSQYSGIVRVYSDATSGTA